MKRLDEIREIAIKLNEYFEAYKSAWPLSGSALVAVKGEIIFQGAFGLADREHNVENKIGTKYWICSITKGFTAAAVMMLHERGELNVHDSIRKYLSDYPEFDERITIHHLLTHTSGIINYNNLPQFFERIQKLYYSQDEFISLFKDIPLEFEPGEKWNYSNSGYYLLGVIIERVSGMPFEKFMQENILNPLEMEDSGFYRENEIVCDRARRYELHGDKYYNGAYDEATKFFAPGGLWSTVGDMLKWDRALYSDKLLSKKSLESIFTPYLSNYGYGWEVGEHMGRKRIGHNGAHSGFFSQVYRYPEDEICIIFLGNQLQNIWGICDDLGAIVLGEDYRLPKKPERVSIDINSFDMLLGSYEEGISLTRKDNKLYLCFGNGEPDFEIYATGENKFNHILIDEQYEFTIENDEIKLWIYGTPLKKIQ